MPTGNFFTDWGHPLEVTDIKTGELTQAIPRYAVWGDLGKAKDEVIEVSDDLDNLRARYGNLPVFEVTTPSEQRPQPPGGSCHWP